MPKAYPLDPRERVARFVVSGRPRAGVPQADRS
jgi:hypothetical protein